MSEQNLHLDLGHAPVCLRFPNEGFAEKAVQQLYLDVPDKHQPIGEIRFVEDNTIQEFHHPSCTPNAVYIKKEAYQDKRQKVTLCIFNKYTVVLEASMASVTVRYPVEAPESLLLDDVLQAALHWVLEGIGGFILHGSCVVRNKVAMAIMGISGAGKSTTAYNLTRLGYTCYADDAVLVVPMGDELVVRPFTRELSIRPLTFRLLRAHGLEISQYRKEGEKYFFKPEKEGLSGAHLKFACLVEVSGESDTRISLLNKDRFELALVEERKHFTFMERDSAEKYASILSRCVPTPFHAAVGTDLDEQAQAMESVFTGSGPSTVPLVPSPILSQGRKQKKEIIRAAWLDPNLTPMAKIIPLLNDFDLQILKLVFGFFQTLPIGKLEPVAKPSVRQKLPQEVETDWLKVTDWSDGCSKLVEESPAEVFRKFAYPWIKSAPLLYPFLAHFSSFHPDKYEHVDAAWVRYKQKRTAVGERATSAKVYMLFPQDLRVDPEEMLTTPHHLGNRTTIVVLPVIRCQEGGLDSLIEFIQHTKEKGYDVQLSRDVPLCMLKNTEADLLINGGLFEMAVHQEPRTMCMYSADKPGRLKTEACLSIKDIHRIDDHLIWKDKPYAACESCRFFSLGLCKGGVYLKGGTKKKKAIV